MGYDNTPPLNDVLISQVLHRRSFCPATRNLLLTGLGYQSLARVVFQLQYETGGNDKGGGVSEWYVPIVKLHRMAQLCSVYKGSTLSAQ